MKFTCERDTILKEISIAHDIISSKNIISILSNVYLEAKNNKLIIKATDLKVSLETEISVEVINPGSTTIYCDKFLSIIKNLPPGEIEFENIWNLLKICILTFYHLNELNQLTLYEQLIK